jgi:AcrR family transcriptional regulator
MSSADAPEARLWGGTTLAARRAERREKLVEAGLDLLGGEGPSAVSVRAVCRKAQLTERYFYESFADRSALVLAVYDQVSGEATAALVEATQSAADNVAVAQAAVEAMVGLIVDDPRRGRVLLVAPLAEPVLAHRVMEVTPALAEMIRDQLSPEASNTDRDMIAIGVLGATMALFYSFLTGGLDVTREEFVDHCVRLLLNVDRLEAP